MSDIARVEHEDGMNLYPENLVESVKKLMGEMEGEAGELLDCDSNVDTDTGEGDPVMMDYMQRLDTGQ